MPKGIYPRDNLPLSQPYSWQRDLPELIATIPTEADAISYLIRHGILKNPKEFTCHYCGYVGCRVKGKNNMKGLKCNRGGCGRSLSLIQGTIFAGTKTPIHQVLYICSLFLSLAPSSMVISQLHCSSSTVTLWYSKLRKWISQYNQIYDRKDVKKEHLMKRVRKEEIAENEAVAVWREINLNNLWQAFLDVLKYGNLSMAEATVENSLRGVESNGTAALQNIHIPLLPPMPYLEVQTADGEEANINSTIEPEQLTGEQTTSQVETAISLKPALEATPQSFEHIDGSFGDSHHDEDLYEPPKKRSKKACKKKSGLMPSFLDICRLVPTEVKAVEYLVSHGIFTLPRNTICTHCGYEGFRQKDKNNPKSLKCNRCSKSQSIARNTLFQHTKASYRTILHLALHWLKQTPRAEILSQLKCSCATVTQFERHFRKLIERNIDNDLQIMTSMTDKKSMAQKIPKGARRNELVAHYCVVSWREMNRENLWEAFLVALRNSHQEELIETDHGVATNEAWVDAEKGVACCKYHLKQHANKSNIDVSRKIDLSR